MDSQNVGTTGSMQPRSQNQTWGYHDTPLTDATYNMMSALHNITDALWHYDQYIAQEQDDDAKEMWNRFKQKDMQMAEELKNHLSRRLQHETGPQGKVGSGPHEGGRMSGSR